MFTLAFDTATRTASVALLEGETVLREETLDTGRNHSETVLPLIDRILKNAKLKIGDVHLFSCTLGPGSFTGVRIAVSTLKGMILATEKPAVGVSTLDALSLNVEPTDKMICAMIDAGRGQVYAALFRRKQQDILQRLTADLCLKPQDILRDIKEDVICVGDGAIKYLDVFYKKAENGLEIPRQIEHHIKASSVAVLGIEKFQRGELLDINACTPVYLRTADVQQKGIENNG
ncbi:MAG TPA: tRNA (adenosine(37)-N6)-threonylcarbamoyltransferase complex dimerization subunit type 1 TsaB [Smithellaceae bacterium]|mgnify:FL=1|nr:tRNA (adenosine(37)-N6)-threonylcarbamoyltransferase complex dimerization subunit type 1 TsaB [Smithellaceae bacterium]HRS88273.1 tRNA (adenosine(37)-N6)-threonylcarbamoyltransferase complex dimerization subunit type 1 TsaB [Smithellaceae bacterium]HRV24918.1 tRNA (adenosine(37)-N6)-threonylcarbamoyltransferase complex dimerization subunit type 1 TsaB [Smithellaceae bacterium]